MIEKPKNKELTVHEVVRKAVNFRAMKIIVLVSLFSLVLCSCNSIKIQDKKLGKDIIEVATELKKMKITDQQVRNSDSFMRFYYGKDDFISRLQRGGWQDNSPSVDSVYFANQGKMTATKKQSYDGHNEHNAIAQNYIDEINTNRLIQMTKKYGFLSHERLKLLLPNEPDTDLTSSPGLIFIHSPQDKIPYLRKLIEKEYRLKRIDVSECSHIFWHLNGRVTLDIDFDYCECFNE